MIDFKTYDNENPEIWEKFKWFSFQAKAKGFKRYSANGIFELIRWHSMTAGNDGFKINNNYRPDYARKMMRMYPVVICYKLAVLANRFRRRLQTQRNSLLIKSDLITKPLFYNGLAMCSADLNKLLH